MTSFTPHSIDAEWVPMFEKRLSHRLPLFIENRFNDPDSFVSVILISIRFLFFTLFLNLSTFRTCQLRGSDGRVLALVKPWSSKQTLGGAVYIHIHTKTRGEGVREWERPLTNSRLIKLVRWCCLVCRVQRARDRERAKADQVLPPSSGPPELIWLWLNF